MIEQACVGELMLLGHYRSGVESTGCTEGPKIDRRAKGMGADVDAPRFQPAWRLQTGLRSPAYFIYEPGQRGHVMGAEALSVLRPYQHDIRWRGQIDRDASLASGQ